MKKVFLFFTFALTTLHSISQNEDNENIKIVFSYNNYRLCNYADKFEVYFFYVDTNNCYNMEKAQTLKTSISTNIDLNNCNLLWLIFKYKNYTMPFRCNFYQKNYNIKELTIEIEKRYCYKKYIKKSYSKSYKKSNRKLGNMEFDVSCNGLRGADGSVIYISNPTYRRSLNAQFRDIAKTEYHKIKAAGKVRLLYTTVSPFMRSHVFSYTNYKKFFIKTELLFNELISLIGQPITIPPQKPPQKQKKRNEK